jgi:hypothetical protein
MTLLCLFIQEVVPGAPSLSPLLSLGVGGAIAVLVLALWRLDRKESSERYSAIAADFRNIVQENTKAMTALCEKMDANGESVKTLELLREVMKHFKGINIEG